MFGEEPLGAVVHPGAVAVRAEHVAVAVRRVVASRRALKVYVTARRRPDHRTALERQADIVARRDRIEPADRVLLPRGRDGGTLSVGHLVAPGRARWLRPQEWEGNGDRYDAVYRIRRPAGPDLALAFAWPDLGVPETVLRLPLAADAGGGPIWSAPALATPGVPPELPPTDQDAPLYVDVVDNEIGHTVAGGVVLHRNAHAAVVLEHVTVFRHALELGVRSVAHAPAVASAARADYAGLATMTYRPGASLAAVRGAATVALTEIQSSGSHDGTRIYEYTARLLAPLTERLTLVVSWPAADLPVALAPVPLPADVLEVAAASEPLWPEP